MTTGRLTSGAALLLLLAACPSAPPTRGAAPDAGARAWVAARRPARVTVVEAPARVVPAPETTALATAPLRATVVRVRVQAGDAVDAGAPLVEVLMPELLDAAGKYLGAQAREKAWSERHAQLELLRQEGLARAPDVSEAGAREAEAAADLASARAVLRGAGVHPWEAEGLLAGSGLVTLRAPIAGVVMEVAAVPGQAREPTQGPLVTVAGAGKSRIEARFAQAPEAGDWTFGWAGGKAAVRLVGQAPVADPRDGTVLAWLEPQEPLPVPGGTLGRVSREAPWKGTAWLVPAEAVQREGGAAHVDTPTAVVPVEVLECSGTSCLVRGELDAGTPVAVGAPR